MIADFERSLTALGGPARSPVTITPVPPAKATPTLTVAASPVRTFKALFDLFLSDPAKTRTPKTAMIYANLLTVVAGVWGEDIALTTIDRTACRELLDLLRWLPSNPAKRFPNLSVMQAARMAKSKGLRSVLSAGSVNGYMAKLSSLMTYAVNEGWLDRNPAKGLRVIDPVRKRDKRAPFSTEQLRLIFSAPLYTGCIDDERHYASVGPNHPRRGRFWIPLIALFSGMRLNEVCQLDVADIQHIDGVDCFYVGVGPAAQAPDKRLKTAASERFIPIHPMLRDIDFMEFVAKQQRGASRKLFPELSISGTGYYSDSLSKWFSRFMDRVGAARPKTCFHSFRHCYRDALREARVSHEVSLALGGWASPSGQGDVETAAAYGRGYRLTTLFQAIEKVEYPGLDLSHLRLRRRGAPGSQSSGLTK